MQIKRHKNELFSSKYYPIEKCTNSDGEQFYVRKCPVCDGTGIRPYFVGIKHNDTDCHACDRMGFIEAELFITYTKEILKIINFMKVTKH